MPEDKGQSMEWVSVFSSDKGYEVEIARMVLQEAGIEAIVLNKRDSSYRFGEVELCVPSGDALRALHILNQEKETRGDD